MAKDRRSRKASRSMVHMAYWHDGRRQHIVEVRGEAKRKALESTLMALPWVNWESVKFEPLRVGR